MPSPLCWVLVTQINGRMFIWSPGFRPVGPSLSLAGVPTWATRAEAARAALDLARTLNLRASPARLATV